MDDAIPPLIESGSPSIVGWNLPPTQHVTTKHYTVTHPAITTHVTARLLGEVIVVSSTFVGRDVIVRGDLAAVTMSPLVFIDSEAIVRPTVRCLPGRGSAEAVPLQVGSATYIGRRCVVEAISIGAMVVMEKDSQVGSGSVVSDGVWIKAGAVVPPSSVLDSFCVYEGNPAKIVGRLDPVTHSLQARDFVQQMISQFQVG